VSDSDQKLHEKMGDMNDSPYRCLLMAGLDENSKDRIPDEVDRLLDESNPESVEKLKLFDIALRNYKTRYQNSRSVRGKSRKRKKSKRKKTFNKNESRDQRPIPRVNPAQETEPETLIEFKMWDTLRFFLLDAPASKTLQVLEMTNAFKEDEERDSGCGRTNEPGSSDVCTRLYEGMLGSVTESALVLYDWLHDDDEFRFGGLSRVVGGTDVGEGRDSSFISPESSDSEEEHGHSRMGSENPFMHPGWSSAAEAMRRVLKLIRKTKESIIWGKHLQQHCSRYNPMVPKQSACFISTKNLRDGLEDTQGPPPSAMSTNRDSMKQTDVKRLNTTDCIKKLTDLLMNEMSKRGHSRDSVVDTLRELHNSYVTENIVSPVRACQRHLDIENTGFIKGKVTQRKLDFGISDKSILVAKSTFRRLAHRRVMLSAMREVMENRETVPVIVLTQFDPRCPNIPSTACFIPRERNPITKQPLTQDSSVHFRVISTQTQAARKPGDVNRIFEALNGKERKVNTLENILDEHKSRVGCLPVMMDKEASWGERELFYKHKDDILSNQTAACLDAYNTVVKRSTQHGVARQPDIALLETVSTELSMIPMELMNYPVFTPNGCRFTEAVQPNMDVDQKSFIMEYLVKKFKLQVEYEQSKC
jgi:hypothetical protein